MAVPKICNQVESFENSRESVGDWRFGSICLAILEVHFHLDSSINVGALHRAGIVKHGKAKEVDKEGWRW